MNKTLDIKQLGERLRAIRIDLGLTQKDIAAELGIVQSMVSKVERGEPVMSNTIMLFFMYYCGKININYLLSENFDITQKDSLYDISFSMNSIVKAKLQMMQEEFNRNMETVQKLI